MFVATGLAHLDALLPHGGLPMGAITELLESEGCAASGAWAVAALFAARAARAAEGGARFVVWIDASGELYPPAALSLGLDPGALLVVRPRNANDALWSFDQAIRCRDVAASVAALPRLTMPILRRLQLAAAAGGGLGLLVRPGREGGDPSAAAVRLRVEREPSAGCSAKPLAQGEPAAGAITIELVRARGGWNQGRVLAEVGCDGAAYSLPRLSPSIE
jgi:hypothetical protein